MSLLLAPRTAPHPYDAKLGSTGLLLARSKTKAPLVRVKQADLSNVVPTDYRYSSSSPLRERPQPYASLVRGFGLDEQQTAEDQRYSYAIGADLSVGTWQKGPDITTFTPGTTSAWASQFGFELGGSLYGLAGRYVLKRVADNNWTVSKDLTAGKTALRAKVVNAAAHAGAPTIALLAVSGANAQWFDGTTWTAFATFTAGDWEVTGKQVWRAHDTNKVNNCSIAADMTVEANWTADFTVGDASSTIISLAKTIGEVLLIFKTDGVYTLASDGTAHHLFSELQFEPGVDNGKVIGYFGNDVYVLYGQTFWRITPDLTIEPVGPERMAYNTSPVRGRITAFCGVGGAFAHGVLTDWTSPTSYVMKFGGFQPDATTGELVRMDDWHGSLSQALSGLTVTALEVSSIGAPSNHTRTYAGDSAGNLYYWTNPCVPNPIGCDQYRWSTTDGYVVMPRWNGTFTDATKALRAAAVTGPLLSSTNWVEFQYMTDPASATWSDLGVRFDTPVREKNVFPTAVSTALARFKFVLKSTANTSTPQVSSGTVYFTLRPDRVMDVEMDVVAADGLMLRNGVFSRTSAQAIRTACETAVDAAGGVLTTLPTSEQVSVYWLDLSESFTWDEDLGIYTAIIGMKGVSLPEDTALSLGTYDRLAAYDYDALTDFNYDSLQTV